MKNQPIQKERNFKVMSDEVNELYKNYILDNINDHCLRMAIMQGEYPWHYHQYTDELFIGLEGELKIEIKDSDAVFLKPGGFIKIPAGTIHKTSSRTRTVNLTFERTGDDTIFVE